jgi:hypothetical protein
MADGKWNIGNVQVHGQAMFGDGNRMEVSVQDPRSQQHIEILLDQLRQAIEALPDGRQGSVRLAGRDSATAGLLELTQELKKKQDERSPGILSRSLQRVMEVLKFAPAALKSALELKSILGL